MKPAPSTPAFSARSIESLTMRARSPGPNFTMSGDAASTGMYSCGPSNAGRFGFSLADSMFSRASSSIFFRPASLKSRVFALACLLPTRSVAVTWRSYCTRLVVIEELAQRVPDRSPPVRFTSTASALAMFKTLSTIALASSRVYMRAEARSRAGDYQYSHRHWRALKYWEHSCTGFQPTPAHDGLQAA